DGNVSVRRLADDAQLIPLKGWGQVDWAGLSFSPDGRFLLHRCMGPGGRLKVYRLNGAAAEVVLKDATSTLETSVVFIPDSRFFATCHWQDGSVAVYDLQSTKADKDKHRLSTGLRPERLAFRPGVAQLAVAGGHVVRVFDLEGKKAPFPDLSHPD